MIPLLAGLEQWTAWVLRTSAATSVLTLVVLAVRWAAGHRLPARWRCALWLLVAARLVMPTLPDRPFSMPLTAESASPILMPLVPMVVVSPVGNHAVEQASVSAAAETTSIQSDRWSPLRGLTVLWVGGALVFLTTALRQRWHLRRLIRHATPSGEAARKLLQACAAELGVARPIRLVESPAVQGPAVTGLWHPTLLLPRGFAEAVSPAELRLTLLHELAHIRRHDPALQELFAWLQVLHWFNPLVWVARRCLRHDGELATDALVLAEGRSALRPAYAATLLKLAEGLPKQPSLAPALGVVSHHGNLKERLTRITQQKAGAYRWSLPAVILLGVLGVTALTQEPPAPASSTTNPVPPRSARTPDEDAWLQAGSKLTPQDYTKLEQEVAAHPSSLEARVKILGYAQARRLLDSALAEQVQPHILWVIREKPESPVAGHPACQIQHLIHPTQYAEAAQVWREQVARHAQNARVLANASNSFLHSEPALSEQLHRKALTPENQTSTPEHRRLTSRLGFLLNLKASRLSGAEAKAVNREALQVLLAGLEEQPERLRFYQLGEVAKVAADAGEFAQARAAAEELLAMAPKFPRDWNHGNAIYLGNMILGRVALQEGDETRAQSLLLAAAKTPGSPQLNSFGPDFTLAKELLQRGHRETVSKFLTEILTFWQGKEDQVKHWQEEIARGKNPSFVPGFNR